MAPHLRSVVAGALGPSSVASSAAPPPSQAVQREPDVAGAQPGPSTKRQHLSGPPAAPSSEEQAPPLDSWEEISSDDDEEEEDEPNEAELPRRPSHISAGPARGAPPGLEGMAQAAAAQTEQVVEAVVSEESERMRLEQERAAGTPTVMADAAAFA